MEEKKLNPTETETEEKIVDGTEVSDENMEQVSGGASVQWSSCAAFGGLKTD